MIIPLFDTLRVFTLRLVYGRSPFSPDRNHIHHIMLDLGLTHRQITVICVLTNAAFIGMAYILRYMGTTLVIAAVLSACFLISGGIQLLRMRSKPAKRRSRQPEIIQSTKVLSFASEPMDME
jgi:predicted small integral membrane protein